MIRYLTLVLLLLLPSGVLAQRVDPPPASETNRPYLTIFTNSNWAQIPQERALIESFGVEPMAGLKARTNFKHYTPADPVYASGRFKNIPQSDFPVVILGNPDGGYFYKASKDTLPSTGQALFEAMRTAYRRDRSLTGPAIVPLLPVNDVSQDCPDGYCPVPNTPDANRDPVFPNAPWNVDTDEDQSLEGFFGGDTPVRDSLGYATIIGVSLLVAIMGMGVLIVGAIVLGLVIWGFRAFSK